MITLQLRNIRTTVHASHQEVMLLTEWLSVKHPTPWFNHLFRRKLWDGVYRFYNTGAYKSFSLPRCLLGHPNTIPTGLVPFVLDHARQINLPIRLEDFRGEPPVTYPFKLHGIPSLYDYQEAAVDKLVQTELVENFPWHRGIVEVATRGGKTAIAGAAAATFRQELVLMVVPGRDLLHQTASDLRTMLGEPIGIIGDNQITVERVTVATAGMLYHHLDDLEPLRRKVRVLIFDECHHLSADTWQDIGASIPAYVRLGLSATPHRVDPVQPYLLASLTGEVLHRVTPKTLINRGIVTPVHMHYTLIDRPLSVKDVKGVYHPAWGLPWNRRAKDPKWQPLAYDEIIVRNSYRNQKIEEFCAATDEPTLVIVSTIEHGELLVQRLGCRFVTGQEPMKARKKILEDMNAGRIRHLVATPVYDEGLTMPKIRRLSLAAAMKSHVKFLQRIGRGMNAEAGKLVLDAQDFLDATNEHTSAHSEERVMTAARAGFKIYTESAAA